MARRRELRTIADGLLNSFVSRNNDVFGYWGIGKLYSLMESTNQSIVIIDLIKNVIIPKSDEFEHLIAEFSKRLSEQIVNRKLNPKHLQFAQIRIERFPNDKKVGLGTYAPHRMNCRFDLTDDLGKTHSIEKDNWCRKHDPTKELKSTRKY